MARKKEKWKWFAIGASATSILTISIVCFYQFHILDVVREETRQEVLLELEKEQKEVIVLNTSVNRGDSIKIGMVKSINIDEDKVPDENHLAEINDLKNMIARVDIPANTILTKSMLVEGDIFVTDDLREEYYANISTPPDIQVGDFVDIRLKRKDGTDFLVVAKKEIKKLNNGIYIDMHDHERALFLASTVEKELEGAILYTNRYVEPENQPPGKVTYEPAEHILNFIEEHPEIAQKMLEQDKAGEARDQSQSTNEVRDQSFNDIELSEWRDDHKLDT